MKRFICYLYEYQGGRRIRNIGFCKVETSEVGSTVSIHGKGWGSDAPGKLAFYLFWREGEKCLGVYQGELNNISPALNYRLFYTKEDMGSERRYEKVEGIILCGDTGPRYAAVWTDEMVDISRMETVPKEEKDNSYDLMEEVQNKKHDEKQTEEYTEITPEKVICPENSREEIPDGKENVNENLNISNTEEEPVAAEKCENEEMSEQECAGTCRFRCRKIQRQDLSRLIRREWQLANNSFLLHGYYNYHHLVFLWEGETMYLGVPGVYSEKEQKAARAFGFPGFVNYEEGMPELSGEDKEEGEDFGYWCRQVHQIRV